MLAEPGPGCEVGSSQKPSLQRSHAQRHARPAMQPDPLLVGGKSPFFSWKDPPILNGKTHFFNHFLKKPLGGGDWNIWVMTFPSYWE